MGLQNVTEEKYKIIVQFLATSRNKEYNNQSFKKSIYFLILFYYLDIVISNIVVYNKELYINNSVFTNFFTFEILNS